MNQQAAPLVVRTVLREAFVRLRAAKVPSHTLAAELLLMHAIGRDRTWLYAHAEEEISRSDAERYAVFLRRRASGEPTQHITGKQEFWGLEFEVTPDVLIPRPETEHLVEVALDRLAVRELRAGRKQTLTGEGLEIADIGTGSGCIAIALAKELPGARIYATDISAAALAIACRNAQRHCVSGRVRFIETSLLDGVSTVGVQPCIELGRGNVASLVDHATPVAELGSRGGNHGSCFFDLITSNPPYIGRRESATLMREVRDYEPEIALYGGEEGYELYADLITQAAAHLKLGGILVVELGHNSLPAVRPLFEGPAWSNVAVTNDLVGIPRVLAAERSQLR